MSNEISKLQKAQDITDKAFSHVLNMLTPEMTELEQSIDIKEMFR